MFKTLNVISVNVLLLIGSLALAEMPSYKYSCSYDDVEIARYSKWEPLRPTPVSPGNSEAVIAQLDLKYGCVEGIDVGFDKVYQRNDGAVILPVECTPDGPVHRIEVELECKDSYIH